MTIETHSSDLQAESALVQMVRTQRVIVMIGSGGVGKTTSAIGIAIAGAKLGKRVALLSIDPAKRLAAALGIPLGHELATVTFPDSANVKGTLRAAMLDQKAVFDSMVRKHAPSPHIADKILRDPMYLAAATNLSGPLEYMALARLQELAENPDIDLVVLDTPPDTHALDFLARPNVLSNFLEGKVISKLLKPVIFAGKLGFSGFAAIGERLLGGVTKLTGFSALRKFGEFIVLMQEVIEGFHASGERVLEILRRPSSSFVLLSVPTKAATRSAEHLGRELAGLGYALDGLILNRCLPEAVVNQLAASQSDEVAILRTRAKGEAACSGALVTRLNALPRYDNMWVCRLDDMEQDLMSVPGILAFAGEMAELPRTKKS